MRHDRQSWLVIVMVSLMLPGPAQAAGDLTAQKPVEIAVQLGNRQGALRFFPDSITLETGKLYRLVLTNPSPHAHYFSSSALAQAVYTRKVQVNGSDSRPRAEMKGTVREIEVYPGATAEWWFVPLKTGEFGDLVCTVPGHRQGGMVGHIRIR